MIYEKYDFAPKAQKMLGDVLSSFLRKRSCLEIDRKISFVAALNCLSFFNPSHEPSLWGSFYTKTGMNVVFRASDEVGGGGGRWAMALSLFAKQ